MSEGSITLLEEGKLVVSEEHPITENEKYEIFVRPGEIKFSHSEEMTDPHSPIEVIGGQLLVDLRHPLYLLGVVEIEETEIGYEYDSDESEFVFDITPFMEKIGDMEFSRLKRRENLVQARSPGSITVSEDIYEGLDEPDQVVPHHNSWENIIMYSPLAMEDNHDDDSAYNVYKDGSVYRFHQKNQLRMKGVDPVYIDDPIPLPYQLDKQDKNLIVNLNPLVEDLGDNNQIMDTLEEKGPSTREELPRKVVREDKIRGVWEFGKNFKNSIFFLEEHESYSIAKKLLDENSHLIDEDNATKTKTKFSKGLSNQAEKNLVESVQNILDEKIGVGGDRVKQHSVDEFLDLLKNEEWFTTTDVSEEVGCNYYTANDYLHMLNDDGFVTKVEAGKANLWKIKEEVLLQNPDRSQILQFLKEPRTNTELVDKFHSEDELFSELLKLEDEGQIEKTVGDEEVRWRVSDMEG